MRTTFELMADLQNEKIVNIISELIDVKIAMALDQYRLTPKPIVSGIVSEARDDGTLDVSTNPEVNALLGIIPLRAADQLVAALHSRGYRIVRDDVTELADLSVKYRRLIEENAKLRAALKPFADWARRDHVREMPIDGPIVFGGPTGRDLNRAMEVCES
jgi:glutamate mutase epsilon subunit